MSATNDLRTALSSLCTIIDCFLSDDSSGNSSGLISPELLRQAKNDEKSALAPLSKVLDLLVDKKLKMKNIKIAVDSLNIATPNDWKSTASLLTVSLFEI